MPKQLNLWRSIITSVHALAAGRLRFRREMMNREIPLADGTFVIFRSVVVDPPPGEPARAGATFVVRFHVANMTLRQNILFSCLPMWAIMGLPGFRSKLWGYIRETGDFQGIYEWQTTADAEAYAQSAAMRFMTRRSVPGSVSFRILPGDRSVTFGV